VSPDHDVQVILCSHIHVAISAATQRDISRELQKGWANVRPAAGINSDADANGTGTVRGPINLSVLNNGTDTVGNAALTGITRSGTGTSTNTLDVTSTRLADTEADTTDTDILAAVILHPQFQETVTKIAEKDLPNHGVKLTDFPIQDHSVAPNVQQGIFDLLLPILTQLGVNGAASQNGIQANAGYYPGKPLPPDVQQGIFDVFTSVLKNPAFTSIVTGIVNGVLAAPK
jgi:hypothetical protein